MPRKRLSSDALRVQSLWTFRQNRSCVRNRSSQRVRAALTGSQMPASALAVEVEDGAHAPQSSLDRLLHVIDLFTPERPEWSADQIGEVMGVSRATRYRYLRS